MLSKSIVSLFLILFGFQTFSTPLSSPQPDPIFCWILFNDGVTHLKLKWETNSYSDFYLQQDFENGVISREDLIPYVQWEFFVQDDSGHLNQVDRLDWNLAYNASVANYDVLVEMITFPMGTVGDIATTTYYLIKGDYEAAAFSSLAIVVPFATGKFFQNGRYLAKLGDETIELAPDEIWRLARGTRGELIESIVAQTKYIPQGFTHMLEASRFWPIFDLVKDNLIVSIKSTQGAVRYGSFIDNIRELKWLINSKGTKNGSTIIDQAEMHVYVPKGFDIHQLDELFDEGKLLGIPIRVFEF